MTKCNFKRTGCMFSPCWTLALIVFLKTKIKVISPKHFWIKLTFSFYLPSWIEEPIGTIIKGCVFRCRLINIPHSKPSPGMFTI